MTDDLKADDEISRSTLLAAMVEATADADPPIQALIDRGRARARKLRTRRRAAWAVGSTATAALVAVGVLAGADRSTGARPAPGPAKHVGPVHPASPAAVFADLRALLPAEAKLAPGGHLDVTRTEPLGSPDIPGSIGVGFDFVYDDGNGVVNVLVDISYGGPGAFQAASGRTCEGNAADFCAQRRSSDGSAVSLQQSSGHGGMPGGPTQTIATLTRPDDMVVTIIEYDVADLTASPNVATRAVPPLSVEQIATVAEAPVWGPAAALIRASALSVPGVTSDGMSRRCQVYDALTLSLVSPGA